MIANKIYLERTKDWIRQRNLIITKKYLIHEINNGVLKFKKRTERFKNKTYETRDY